MLTHTLITHKYIQWNLSNPDTNRAEESVIVSEVSSISEVEMHARVVLGVGKGVLFREVSLVHGSGIEGFHYIHAHTHAHHCRRQLEKHAIFGVNNAELRFRVQYYVTSVTKLEFEVTR